MAQKDPFMKTEVDVSNGDLVPVISQSKEWASLRLSSNRGLYKCSTDNVGLRFTVVCGRDRQLVCIYW